MNILIDIGHPGHVHFFRHAAHIWQSRGHQVQFVAREKDITFQLMKDYGLPFTHLSSMRKGMLGLAVELIEHEYRLAGVIRDFEPDVILEIGGTFIVHVAKLMKIPTIVFTDTEHAKLSNAITFPFATHICTPTCYYDELGKKQIRYNGYQELAYLHPRYFKPSPQTLKKTGLNQNEKFFIIRFISWGASHDVSEVGFSQHEKISLVEQLSTHGRVIITSEGDLPPSLESFKLSVTPILMHDLMHYADLYIGEGITMASEAAILGTPSILVNTMTTGYIIEQREKYHVTYQYSGGTQAIQKALELVASDQSKAQQREKVNRMLNDKIDVTAWMVDFVENYPSSAHKEKR
jgi:hypothetical protein